MVQSIARPLPSPVPFASGSCKAGVIQALPITAGYIPVAFAFGVLAAGAKLSFLSTFLMSLLVYAGASQFIALGMIAAGMPILPIVFTTFIVNLRHLLLSMAIAPYLSGWNVIDRIKFGLQMTDEVFSLHILQFQSEPASPPPVLATNATAHGAWMLGTVLGYLFASQLGDFKTLGLDFALPAMFIYLLVRQLTSRLMFVVALASGVMAVFFKLHGLETWAAILATFISAALGAGVHLCKKVR